MMCRYIYHDKTVSSCNEDEFALGGVTDVPGHFPFRFPQWTGGVVKPEDGKVVPVLIEEIQKRLANLKMERTYSL